MLQNYFGTVLLSLICITKSYLTDYLRLNVIYDAAVGLQVRISTTQLRRLCPNLIRQVEV